ncbi:MAG TPA: MerR family transcriptional regulator [Blastocatellia bacterium]|nr:MerR family transcriptional regulator [Blastocatellia bacterium]
MLEMSNEDTTSQAGKYRIGTVTRLTGLSADVVRVWERRYGAIRPQRSDAGTRLYSDADIARLRRLRQAVEKGHTISQAARLSDDELTAVTSEVAPAKDASSPYALVRERFLSAIMQMDVVTADLEMSRAATLFPARDLINQIVSPLLAEIGDRWAHREFGVAHEHVATNLLRNLLSSLIRLYPPDRQAETIVLATPAGERHEFGILLAALVAATRGWRVVYVGTDLPAGEIAYAVRLAKSRYLALSLVNQHPEAAEELNTLAQQLPASVRVWVGGGEAIQYRDLLHQLDWILIRDLDDLDDRLRR